MARQTLVTVIDADTRKFRNGIRRSKNFAIDFAKNIVKVGAIVVGAYAAMTLATAKYGDEVDKINRRTGLQTDEIQKLILASKLAGTEITTVEKASRKLSQSVLDLELGLSTAKDGFRELGIGLDVLKGKDAGEQLKIVLEALNAIPDETRRAAVGMKILGKSGTALLPLADSLAETLEIAEKDLVLLTPEQVKQSADFIDNLTRIKAIIGSGIRSLTVQAFPELNRGMGNIIDRLRTFVKSEDFGEMGTEINRLAKNIGAAVSQFTGGEISASNMLDLIKAINEQLEEMTGDNVFGTLAESVKGIATVVAAIVKGIQKVADFVATSAFLLLGENRRSDFGDRGRELSGREGVNILNPFQRDDTDLISLVRRILDGIDKNNKIQTTAQ